MRFYAHSENSGGKKELVAEHLRETASLTQQFAAAWGGEKEGEVAALLHDLGKYSTLFDKVLKGEVQNIDHATPGAKAALKLYRNQGIAVALAIEGHHDGLLTGIPQELNQRVLMREPVSLRGKTYSSRDIETLLGYFRRDGLVLPQSIESPYQDDYVNNRPIAAMLYTRMLFSALVDGDFIATEAHFNSENEGYCYREAGMKLKPTRMLKALDDYLADIRSASKAEQSIRSLRDDLFRACLKGGEKPRGIYTLTAPTGSGKTLSMLAYALKHAATHNLRRIIIVLPYLSIIEQNAQTYRQVFASLAGDPVLEDHSLLELPEEHRLLAENWDAPIIITTTVRFFEGLFSNRSSACRRLHNIANSVILFDEAQAMPARLTLFTLAAVSQLVHRYRCSVTFATATQPAFETLNETVNLYSGSGWQPEEIVPDHLKLYQRNRQVRVNWLSQLSWEEISKELANKKQVLAVLNTRRQAKILYELVNERSDPGETYHLSTTMCPAHRLAVLDTVRDRLDMKDTLGKSSCRLISTQCIEAGVDIDFPQVWRALGPLEAISQAAGRCNREGRLPHGEVTIFRPPREDDNFPDVNYHRAAVEVQLLLAEKEIDINDPKIIREYYRRYFRNDLKRFGTGKLAEAIQAFDFEETNRLYRWIPANTINILVPYKSQLSTFHDLCLLARKGMFNRDWIKGARPLSVGFWRNQYQEISSFLEPVLNRRNETTDWYILLAKDAYCPKTGLDFARVGVDQYLA